MLKKFWSRKMRLQNTRLRMATHHPNMPWWNCEPWLC